MPTSSAADEWRPTDADMEKLGAAGGALVAGLIAAYQFTAAEGPIVLEAGFAASALAAIRGTSTAGLTAGEINTLQRLEQGWSRLLAAHLGQLKVGHAD